MIRYLDRLPEPDIVGVNDVGPALAVHIGVGPGQLKRLHAARVHYYYYQSCGSGLMIVIFWALDPDCDFF